MTLARWGAMLFTSLLALCGFAQRLCAQADTGTISGIVRDSGDRIVAGAVVKLLHNETGTGTRCVTNSEGLYSVPDLRIGKYSVSASAEGFATAVRPDIEVRVQDSL